MDHTTGVYHQNNFQITNIMEKSTHSLQCGKFGTKWIKRLRNGAIKKPI